MRGANTIALSTHLPVIIISAPCSNAATIPGAPRYALMLKQGSGRGRLVSISLTPSSISLGNSSIRSSPITKAIFRSIPAFSASFISAFRHALRFSPPALDSTVIFFSLIWLNSGASCSTKSVAYPISVFFFFAPANIDMVTSARKSNTR